MKVLFLAFSLFSSSMSVFAGELVCKYSEQPSTFKLVFDRPSIEESSKVVAMFYPDDGSSGEINLFHSIGLSKDTYVITNLVQNAPIKWSERRDPNQECFVKNGPSSHVIMKKDPDGVYRGTVRSTIHVEIDPRVESCRFPSVWMSKPAVFTCS